MGPNHDIEIIASNIVDSAIVVHRSLGPGLLESAYQSCLTHELRDRGLTVACEVLLPLKFRNLTVEAGYRVDMIVGDQVIVENKAAQAILHTHEAQLLTYLRLSDLRIGFLINWNTVRIKDGIKRMVNRL